MLNLFDMLAQAQNGNGVDALAQQFNLSQQQAQAAIQALLPAFSQGLKRNTSDPYGLGAFLSAMGSGQHAKYFEDAGQAFSPQGMAEGNGILGHLFGSKELSRAVASQAAQATGLGQQVLQQMLPAIASMIMGGLYKQSMNQMPGAQAGGAGAGGLGAGGFGAGGNPLQEIIEQMMKQGGGFGMPQQQAPQQSPQGANPFDNPFGKILQDMFGGAAGNSPTGAQPRAQPSPGGPGDNPWGKILEEMLGGGAGNSQPRARKPDPQPQPRTNPSGRQRNPYDDIFGDMFDAGAKHRDEYQKGVESIFDQFKRGMDRR